ncbi:MAG: NAD-dependent epimerase/dehydratase family protein [Chitinophagales bacterium]|nr:NAD-dependent epimerase/dehydratase family protein [Chitinophagales bacterium]
MKNILITGSQGYIGKQFLASCFENRKDLGKIIALDIKKPEADKRLEGVDYIELDIRSKQIEEILKEHQINIVVHLAAIISITGTNSALFEYDVDVNGSKNLINACVRQGVEKFIITSSGAAYGYWPSNVETVLSEDMPMLGNTDIPYSNHKYLVEEYLKKIAKTHPKMEQFVFRVGTILGETTNNPITDYLKKDKLLCIQGYPSAFVAIWDQDLVQILWKACLNGKPGIYNVAGDGAIPSIELASLLGKSARVLPLFLLKTAFAILRPLSLIKYGPESLKFIQYRPVLSNQKLKESYAYIPQKNTKEVFEFWRDHQLS